MKNRKIISFICAIAMVMSVFAGFTTVNAAGSKGIGLEASLNDTATELTVVVKAVGMTDGVSAADVRFNVPEAQVDKDKISYVSTLESGDAEKWANFTVNDGQLKMNFFESAPVKFKDNVLATITIPFTSALDKDYTITLGDKSTIKDTVLVKVGDGDDQMEAVSSKAANPIAKTEKPEGGKPGPFESTEPEPLPPVADKKGIQLAASLNDTNDVLTVVVTALNMPDGVSAADVRFNVPEAQVDKDKISYVSTLASGDAEKWANFTVNDGQLKMNFFESAPVKFKDNVLATITIPLTTPITGLTEIKLGDKSTIKDTVLIKVGDGTTENTMVATSVLVKPSKENVGSTDVALEDYMGEDKATGKSAAEVAKEAEANEGTYGALWLDVQITKDDGNGGRTDAKYGDDFVALYDLDGDGTPEELTEKQYRDLISGNIAGVKMSDVIENLQYRVYDTAQNVQINTNLFAEKMPTSLVNKNENTEVEQGGTSSDKTAAATMTPKTTSKNATVGSPVTEPFRITLAKNKKGEYVPNKTNLVINVDGDSYDALSATGVSVAYTYDDNGEDKKITERILLSDADTDVTLKHEAKNNTYTVTFTPVLATPSDKPIKYTVSFTDGNGNPISSTLTYKAREAASGNTGSSGNTFGSDYGYGLGTFPFPLIDQNASKFTDLGTVPWAQEAINALAARGIISGRSDTIFDPNANITRAEYCQILVGAIGHMNDSADVVFADVPTDAWFYHAVAVASSLGIVEGYGDGNFGPNDLIKRQDMALMTMKAGQSLGMTFSAIRTMSFADAGEVSDYAATAVQTLADAGIINGVSDTEFAPKDHATRAQSAKILYDTFVRN